MKPEHKHDNWVLISNKPPNLRKILGKLEVEEDLSSFLKELVPLRAITKQKHKMGFRFWGDIRVSKHTHPSVSLRIHFKVLAW